MSADVAPPKAKEHQNNGLKGEESALENTKTIPFAGKVMPSVF